MDLYFKTVLVFMHFSMAAYCIVSVVGTDWEILKAYSKPVTEELLSEITCAKTTIKYALCGLWITGMLIVAYGTYTSLGYLANPKLWFKLFVVVVLTLNGLLVHKLSTILKPGLVLASLDDKMAFKLNLAGVVSSVSWIWACFVGTARAWNDTLPFATLMVFYLTSLAVGIAVAVFLHNHQKKRTQVLLSDPQRG